VKHFCNARNAISYI
jgi:hypothetical protein